MRTRIAATVAALLLVLAACSSGDDSASTDDTDDTAGDDTGGEPTDGAGIEVSDRSVGVTDESIKIGFTYRDLRSLNVGVDNGDFAEIIETLVADTNASGGINGRQVEVVPLGFSPIDEASQLSNCVAFTEDEEAFAVLGDFDSEAALLCVIEQHETIAVASGGITEERLDRTGAPFLTPSGEVERSLEAFVQGLRDGGHLEAATLAVHATNPTDQDMARSVVIPALEEADIDVALESFPAGFPDAAAVNEAMAIELERYGEAGIDTVFVVGNDTTTIARALSNSGYEAALLITQVGPTNAFDIMGIDPLVLEGAIGVQAPYLNDRYDDPNAQECFDIWNAAHPDQPVKEDYEDDEANVTVGLGDVCRTWQVFVAAATAAGDKLTHRTFLEGAEGTGAISVAVHGDGSLAAGKYGVQDEFQLVTWSDPGLNGVDIGIIHGWEAAGDPIIFEG